jgi:hypothetical protein
MLAVMTLNVVMSVMSGFEETLRDRLLGINAYRWCDRAAAARLQLLAEMSKGRVLSRRRRRSMGN